MKNRIAWSLVLAVALAWACSSESNDGALNSTDSVQDVSNTPQGTAGIAGLQPSAGDGSGTVGLSGTGGSSQPVSGGATAAGNGGRQTTGSGGKRAVGVNGAGGNSGSNAANAGSAGSKTITFEDAIASIKEADIRADLSYLASDKLEGRKSGTEGDQKAIDYIVGKFKEFGLEGKNGEYTQPFTAAGTSTANAIGILPGSDPVLKDEVIVVGGHHDHVGVRFGQTYNGADDNASGTTVVISTARALSKFKGKLKRTVVLMAFGAEELGLYGSQNYADNPWFPMDKTVFMLDIDMVGHLKDNQVTGSTEAPVAKEFLTKICDKYKACNNNDFPTGSDYEAFRDKGVPVHFFFTDFHDCYHQACDKIDTVDMPGVTTVAKMSFELTYQLANADKSPRSNFEVPAFRSVGTVLDHGREPFLTP